MKECAFTLVNELNEIPRMSEYTAKFCRSNSLKMGNENALNLVLEELFTNIVKYGFEDREPHSIDIRMELLDSEVEVEISDDGRPFNPMESATPDIDRPLEEREIGGLGIHIVRKLMHEVKYERKGEKNILSMKMKKRD